MIKETIEKNAEVKVNSKEMEILQKHFPSCFDKDGKFDIKVFEELIKTEDVDIKKEGYSLDFLGKSYARYLASLDSETVIVPDEGNKDINSENIYIVGDNLDALQHLKYSYFERIKCIYIDPPYNTGSDGFVYNDKFEFTAEELAKKIGIEQEEAERVLKMQGTSTHSAWLTFMYPRLELARDLLKDSGVIFISIDDNEQANCKFICDSIFGEGNFIDHLHWKKKKQPSFLATHTAKVMEHILVYAKKKECLEKLSIEGTTDQTKKVINVSNTIAERKFSAGVRVKKNGDGIIKKGSYTIKTMTVEYLDDVIYKNGKTQNEIRVKARFLVSQEKIDDFIRDGLLFITKNNGLRRDVSLEEIGKRKSITDLLLSDWGDNQEGENDFVALFGESYFDYTKPVDLLKNIIKSNFSEEEIVMDFFSGSGTFGQAVLELNAENDVVRPFILVQLDESLDSSCARATGEEKERIANAIAFLDSINKSHSIDEIGRERIRRAAKKIAEENPEKAESLDLGFKTYYLRATDKQTLDKIVDFDPAFPLDKDDIKAQFGKDTIIETWKIKDGYGFNAEVKEIDLKGYTAYLLTDSKVGTSLYLIDDMPDNAIVELVRKIEAYELNVDRIIEYGYAFSHDTNTALRSNLKTLKNRNAIEPIIRY